MARSRFDVDNVKTEIKHVSFWNIGKTLLFTLIIGAIVFVLMITTKLYESIVQEEILHDVGYRYSILILSQMHPETIQPDWAFKDPARLLNVIADSKPETMSPEEYWLRYLAVKTMATSSDASSAIKKNASKTMESMLNTFKEHMPVHPMQWLVLARDSMAIHSLNNASFFYSKLLNQYPHLSLPVYQEGVLATRWAKECKKSADLALQAQAEAKILNDKRYFFFQAIQTLFQCEAYQSAMDLAKKNLGDLYYDKVSLLLLTDYVLKAGDPAYANTLMIQVLSLPDNNH